MYQLERNFEKFGKYLLSARIKNKLTQAEVSKRLGYSTAQFISNFERGIALPPAEKTKKLITIYNLNKQKTIDLMGQELVERLKKRLQ